MKKKQISPRTGLLIFIVGILLGTVFTFGMQYWNKEVPRESCTTVKTKFLSYDEDRRLKKPSQIVQIFIDCTNGERYVIDGASVNTELRNALSALKEGENITLLIHPNSDTIVEFSNAHGKLLFFEDTIKDLTGETTGFLILGIFLYLLSLLGLYHIVSHFIQKRTAAK